MESVRFSCVIDDNPLFKMQALNWLRTIIASGSARPEEIVVHLIGDKDRAYRGTLDRFGITVRTIEPFGPGEAAYCNKLMQFDCPELRSAGCAVLCDTDLAVVGDIRPWINVDSVRAKVVDVPNPPLAALKSLYAAAGLPARPRKVKTSFKRGKTFETNCNGGLYIIPSQWFEKLAEAWTRWARFALERGHLLGPYLKHSDQIGFCFAMLELGLPFQPLPDELNFPTHLSPESYSTSDAIEPLVLHYHRRMDQSGFLLPMGKAGIDAAINKVNDVIRRYRHDQYDILTFWDYRYARHPDLGSGLGSRGDALAYRKELLHPLVSRFAEKEILDVGCGDLEVMAGADARQYTGLDISAQAISIARGKRPDWSFVTGKITAVEGKTYDLVLCGCVLIHISDRDDYLDHVRRLVDACRDTLIIEAYNNVPTFTSEITFYHEPITETLARDSRIGEIKIIGSYRDIDVVLARRK